MAGTTPRGLHRPVGNRDAGTGDPMLPQAGSGTGVTDVGKLADTVDQHLNDLNISSAAADRPAAGVRGRWHRATNTGEISYDDGTGWRTLDPGRYGNAGDRPSSMPRTGMTYYAIDTGDQSTWWNGGWMESGSESRVLTTAGSTFDGTNGVPALGDLTVRGPVTWTREAQSGSPQAKLVPNKPGRYRVTATIGFGTSGNDFEAALLIATGAIPANRTIDSTFVSNQYRIATLHGIANLTDGQGVYVQFVAGTATSAIVREIVMERLGW